MQFHLPITDELRKAWTIEAPAEIQNSGSDYVAYHLPNPKDLEENHPYGRKATPGATPNFPNEACYAALRPCYGKVEVVCHPLQKPKAISFSDAFAFFNLLTEDGVIPEGVVLWEEEKGIFCQIPKGVGDPPTIYATLCCYRWLDSKPRLVWEFVRLMAQERRHSLQVLTYLTAKHKATSGHSFFALNYNNPQGQYLMSSPYNPCLGLGAKLYFDTADPRGRESYENRSSYVNSAINSVTGAITPAGRTRQETSWGAQIEGVKVPRFLCERSEDGLHPDLYELYTIPQITQEQIESILGRLFTKEKKP